MYYLSVANVSDPLFIICLHVLADGRGVSCVRVGWTTEAVGTSVVSVEGASCVDGADGSWSYFKIKTVSLASQESTITSTETLAAILLLYM